MDFTGSALRSEILELYGLDIDDADQHFSTHNYAFVFPESPFMVRVNVGATKSREEALSEVLWLDDLKAFSETVCEPAPSKAGNLVEEFVADGTNYRVSMFRTAKGNVKDASAMEPLDIICVGDLLGRIHKAGADALSQGITYKFHEFEVGVDRLIARCKGAVSPEIYNAMEAIHGKIAALPKDPASFGLIHGDFHSNNFFMDGHNVWVFDFDNVVYGHYLYDIAECIYETWLYSGYKWPKPRRQVFQEDVLPYFKQGYEFHHQLPEGSWDLLELFMREHVILPVSALSAMPKDLLNEQLATHLARFTKILMARDVFDATDEVVAATMAKTEDVTPANTVESEHFTLLEQGDSATVYLKERLDTNNAEEVGKQLLDLAETGHEHLTIDGSHLVYLSSAGIRVIVRLLKALGELHLARISPEVLEVLEVTGITSLPGLVVEE